MPITPQGLRQYDQLPAEEAVLQSWVNPGKFPAAHDHAQRVIRDSMPLLYRALTRLEEERRPLFAIPIGLCDNKEDHDPHMHDSRSLGTYFCHADQSRRLPYRLEETRK